MKILNLKRLLKNGVTRMIKPNSKKVNVIIPMAGRGKRFLDAGYSTPKPLLDLNGKPMIEYVIDCMRFPNVHFIFLILQEHIEKYNLQEILKSIEPSADIIVVNKVTEGAICTVLLAKHLIDSEEEVFIKDSDQVLNWVPEHFLDFMRRNNADGGIQTVHTDNPGYSFAKIGDHPKIIQTAEKIMISNYGATGCYYFAKGKDLIKYANQMIEKNIRTNNQFIEDGKSILNYPIAEMYGLNTPEEFESQKHLVAGMFSP